MTGVTRRDCLARLLTAPLAGLAAGCALFEKRLAPLTSTAKKLPPITLPPNAIQLDVTYVERPANDPLLGSPLWEHVDQLAAVEREARVQLQKNGFRVGVTASNPPVALQKMLGLRTDFAYTPEAERAKQLVGHRCIVMSGGQTEIQVSKPYPECSLEIPTGNDVRSANLENARCSYRLAATKLQDGWVQLEFTPQIHHGDLQHRPVVEGQTWRYQTGQQVEIFYEQRFQVKLSVGEIALVTAEEGSKGKLGDLFFRGPSALRRSEDESNDADEAPALTTGVQRLLVVRLSGLQAEGPHAPS